MNGRCLPWVRNLLITLGAFWLSLQALVLFAWLFGRLNSRAIYGDGVLDAIAMGVMTSMGRAMTAALAAAIVALSAAGPKPERWAFIVAALYVVDVPVRMHWHLPPTAWDRLWQSVDLLWPAFACVVVAIVTARLRRKWGDAGSKKALWVLGAALVASVSCSVIWPQVMLHSKAAHRVTVEEVLKQLQSNTPVGTGRPAVESYLDSRSITHSYVDNPEVPNERRVELALIRDTSQSWLARGDIEIRFRFDQSDRLLDYSAHEVFRGP
jgi:hypothetical protein